MSDKYFDYCEIPCNYTHSHIYRASEYIGGMKMTTVPDPKTGTPKPLPPPTPGPLPPPAPEGPLNEPTP